MLVWEMVTDVILLRAIWAYVCLGMNILFCGTGTILMSILGDNNISKTHFIIGVLQFLCWLTSVILLGLLGVIQVGGIVWLEWAWSVYWGYLIVKKVHTATED